MNLLDAMNVLTKEGYYSRRFVEINNKVSSSWQIYPEETNLYVISETVLIEKEDGTDHVVKAGELFKIGTNAFFKISSEAKQAKYLLTFKPSFSKAA